MYNIASCWLHLKEHINDAGLHERQRLWNVCCNSFAGWAGTSLFAIISKMTLAFAVCWTMLLWSSTSLPCQYADYATLAPSGGVERPVACCFSVKLVSYINPLAPEFSLKF
jgi:hypothetical protein